MNGCLLVSVFGTIGGVDASRGRIAASVVLWLSAAAGLVGVSLLYRAFSLTLTLLGDEADPADAERALPLIIVGVGCCTVGPALGLWLAVHMRRWHAVAALVPLLVIGLLLAWFWGFFDRESLRDYRDKLWPPPTVEPYRPGACQEYSGGGNRCPGG